MPWKSEKENALDRACCAYGGNKENTKIRAKLGNKSNKIVGLDGNSRSLRLVPPPPRSGGGTRSEQGFV